LAAFADALSLDSFLLVGHSMGGRNSMAFAGRYPERVQKLVIVDIGPVVDAAGSERITRELSEVPEEFDSFESVVAYMAKQNRFASDAVLRRRLTYAAKVLPNGRIGWKYDPEIREQRRRNTGAPAVDLWPSLANITCPTLVVRGTETDLLTEDTAGHMVDTLAQGRAAQVRRAGHMVFEDNPQDFISEITSFLK
jgi:pimeloyl-ACP methyl ester carboxylesterase